MAKSVLLFVGIALGTAVGFSASHFIAPATAAGAVVSAGAVEVVRCTNEANGIPFDTSADDHWVPLNTGDRSFRSEHGKYFFAPDNHECIVITAPAKTRS